MNQVEPENSVHLDDGAYVTITKYAGGYYELMFTANHHDPKDATGVVHLTPRAVKNLLSWLERHDDG